MTGEAQGVRIAMWSGPRNISTALLRSWGNRHDTFVCDEPLYAFYLERTGVEHPGREEVLAHHDSDWRRVVRRLTGKIPAGKAIFYQKHMAHHLLPEIDRAWVSSLANAFLIRNPEEMLTSLTRVMPRPGVEDTGLPQQWELFGWLRERTGRTPPVVDSDEFFASAMTSHEPPSMREATSRPPRATGETGQTPMIDERRSERRSHGRFHAARPSAAHRQLRASAIDRILSIGDTDLTQTARRLPTKRPSPR